ncbi:hypothetical protein AB0A70_01115 [Streptomyces morookaense]|uniref:hypothetical protein n=1 Tax=Streptomyces morookaense TaxID=1970 RepID=UPI0033C06BF7
MSAGGSGIPRLQDLAYIEVAAQAVAEGRTFDEIRCALVGQAAKVARDSDTDGSFDERKWDRRRADGKRHVHNTVDVLKELMRLGWVERHILPSTPNSAYAHSDVTFRLTGNGVEWTALVRHDRLAAYNVLIGVLLGAHPQFEGFLRLVGARPDRLSTHFTIPLLKFDNRTHHSHQDFLGDFVDYAVDAATQGSLGWSAAREVIDHGVRGYVGRAEQRLSARERVMSRKLFITTCEEAMVRVAFSAAGCNLDYISHELLRRWTRFLGLTNFSYYAPGPPALRFWATSEVSGRGGEVAIRRSVGREARQAALEALPQIWLRQRGDAAGDMYLPVWRLRAAVCWHQRISDDEFDAAILGALRGDYPGLGFRVHLDQATHGATPPSTRPLVMSAQGGMPRVFNIIRVDPTHQNEEARN